LITVAVYLVKSKDEKYNGEQPVYSVSGVDSDDLDDNLIKFADRNEVDFYYNDRTMTEEVMVLKGVLYGR
jgi:hypothetical protein